MQKSVRNIRGKRHNVEGLYMNDIKHKITTEEWDENSEAVFSKWRTVKLSVEEKKAMRQAILSKISDSKMNSASSLFSIFDFFRRPAFALASFAVILVISGGFGVARAEQASLPGEWLYPVKVRVNEPIQGLIRSDAGNMLDWECILIARRINEANELASQGRLGENEQKVIDELLNKHVAELRKSQGGNREEEKTVIQNASEKAERLEIQSEGEDGELRYRVRARSENRNEHKKDNESQNEGKNKDENDDKSGKDDLSLEKQSEIEKEIRLKEKKTAENIEKSGKKKSILSGSTELRDSKDESASSSNGNDTDDEEDAEDDSNSGSSNDDESDDSSSDDEPDENEVSNSGEGSSSNDE